MTDRNSVDDELQTIHVTPMGEANRHRMSSDCACKPVHESGHHADGSEYIVVYHDPMPSPETAP